VLPLVLVLATLVLVLLVLVSLRCYYPRRRTALARAARTPPPLPARRRLPVLPAQLAPPPQPAHGASTPFSGCHGVK
jgi:hypothetical protein